MGFLHVIVFENYSIVIKALSSYETGDGNRGPETSRTCSRSPSVPSSVLRQEGKCPSCRSCFLCCRHSFGVKAQAAWGQAVFRVSFRVAPLQKLIPPLFIVALRLKDGALIASSAQASRPAGHAGGAAPPNRDLTSCPLGKGERGVGADRAGLGHRVRP